MSYDEERPVDWSTYDRSEGDAVMPKFKMLSPTQREAIEREICMMLHASRDCLRNQGVDTLSVRFDARDSYYGEAFGMMRTLHVLGYGTYAGSSNIPDSEHPHWNLRWWFCQLEQRVLDEEHYDSHHECAHCFERYGRDDTRTR